MGGWVSLFRWTLLKGLWCGNEDEESRPASASDRRSKEAIQGGHLLYLLSKEIFLHRELPCSITDTSTLLPTLQSSPPPSHAARRRTRFESQDDPERPVDSHVPAALERERGRESCLARKVSSRARHVTAACDSPSRIARSHRVRRDPANLRSGGGFHGRSVHPPRGWLYTYDTILWAVTRCVGTISSPMLADRPAPSRILGSLIGRGQSFWSSGLLRVILTEGSFEERRLRTGFPKSGAAWSGLSLDDFQPSRSSILRVREAPSMAYLVSDVLVVFFAMKRSTGEVSDDHSSSISLHPAHPAHPPPPPPQPQTRTPPNHHHPFSPPVAVTVAIALALATGSYHAQPPLLPPPPIPHLPHEPPDAQARLLKHLAHDGVQHRRVLGGLHPAAGDLPDARRVIGRRALEQQELGLRGAAGRGAAAEDEGADAEVGEAAGVCGCELLRAGRGVVPQVGRDGRTRIGRRSVVRYRTRDLEPSCAIRRGTTLYVVASYLSPHVRSRLGVTERKRGSAAHELQTTPTSANTYLHVPCPAPPRQCGVAFTEPHQNSSSSRTNPRVAIAQKPSRAD
ncbi:hypothetical protein MBM_08905 [Drepanopeziza brunnea f. sp. 'multigermtubi' MB_m1]|uniref:Uncharacterized protein n=1 Tax=Marssonina brunnea f. sp. multigermtubi (strain MB_m1) TaxID=1072389 RepID=K1WJA6_MARBU|nr:uncharacterized protein MBM_08905 [Drepanopeziza brunnea f. sp. 'multigermtubi' MB_m1]EKD12951.1 hypothetical protein MBM_08905 [Drepanopeziza brunnea f. sp. 'multigermtubi' MB_m1]